MRGLLLVLSGPSGVGKSTIHGIFKNVNSDFKLSVSATTRKPREGEIDGVNYYFRTDEEFDELIKNDAFIEHVEFSKHRYGTLKSEIDRITQGGDNVVLDVEAIGALNIKKKYPAAVLIFILPPSIAVLKNRLFSRGSETPEEVADRMDTFKAQLSCAYDYDYVVVNDDKEKCADEVQKILSAERRGERRFESTVEANKELITSLLEEV